MANGEDKTRQGLEKKNFLKAKKKKKKERKKAMNLTIYPVGDIMTEKNYSKCVEIKK